MNMDNKIVSKIKSLYKAFRIIDLISDYKDELSLSEIAKLMNLSSSSIHHILSSLINNGYIKQNEKINYMVPNLNRGILKKCKCFLTN